MNTRPADMNTTNKNDDSYSAVANSNTEWLKSNLQKHCKAVKTRMMVFVFCSCWTAMAAPPALPRPTTAVDSPVQNLQPGPGGAPYAPVAYLADEAPLTYSTAEAPLGYPAVEAPRAQPTAKAPLAQPAPRAPLAQPAPRAPLAQPTARAALVQPAPGVPLAQSAPRAPRLQPPLRAPLAQPEPTAPRAPNTVQLQFAPSETRAPSIRPAQSAPAAPLAASTPAVPGRTLVGCRPNQFRQEPAANPTVTNRLGQKPQPAPVQEQLNRIQAQGAVRSNSLTDMSNSQAPGRYGLSK